MKNRFYLYIFFAIVLLGCSKTGKHTTSNGLTYILHNTEDKPVAVKGEILQLRFTYSTDHDSSLFSSDALTDSMVLEYRDMKYGAMTEALGLLGEGDSATFFLSPDSVFSKVFETRTPAYFNAGQLLKWNVKLVKKFTRDEFTRMIDERLRQTSAMEDKQIQSYCMANEIMAAPTASGLVYISFTEGKGSPVKMGDTLVVKYTGRFLNGQIFDSSEDGTGSVRFIIGRKEMIKGWEEGFMYMKEGGTARFVVPSRLGYGIKGFGPVPGDTPVVYDVELVKVIGKGNS